MPLAHGGLVKLVEECGELAQVAAKKIAYPDTDDHPDGKGSLKARTEDEIADVQAACMFVRKHLGLDNDRLTRRIKDKLGVFERWSVES